MSKPQTDFSTFGFCWPKLEGAPGHPSDHYVHCGCTRCDVVWRRQGKRFFTHLKSIGWDISKYESDPWFPESLKRAGNGS